MEDIHNQIYEFKSDNKTYEVAIYRNNGNWIAYSVDESLGTIHGDGDKFETIEDFQDYLLIEYKKVLKGK